jgi:hypothetical protein
MSYVPDPWSRLLRDRPIAFDARIARRRNISFGAVNTPPLAPHDSPLTRRDHQARNSGRVDRPFPVQVLPEDHTTAKIVCFVRPTVSSSQAEARLHNVPLVRLVRAAVPQLPAVACCRSFTTRDASWLWLRPGHGDLTSSGAAATQQRNEHHCQNERPHFSFLRAPSHRKSAQPAAAPPHRAQLLRLNAVGGRFAIVTIKRAARYPRDSREKDSALEVTAGSSPAVIRAAAHFHAPGDYPRRPRRRRSSERAAGASSLASKDGSSRC